jgi:hypothetical protein
MELHRLSSIIAWPTRPPKPIAVGTRNTLALSSPRSIIKVNGAKSGTTTVPSVDGSNREISGVDGRSGPYTPNRHNNSSQSLAMLVD